MRVVVVGAGGHASVVIDALLLAGTHEPVALLDPLVELHGSNVLGVPVAGDDSLLPSYLADGVRHAAIGLGGAQGMRPRRRLCERVFGVGFEAVATIHPAAVVSPHAEIGDGPTVLATAVVNAGARLGDHVIVNTAAVVEHDCRIGDYAHVATGATLASGVEVGSGAHVGAGASVRQGIRIGEEAVVGMGAVVVDNVPDRVVVVGIPARPLRAVPS